MSDSSLIITTRSGSVYDIHDGRWWRNGRGGNQIMAVFGMPPDMTVQEAHGWERYDVTSIQVGRRLYIAGFHEFAMSTHVTEIVVKPFGDGNVTEANA
jgi:hypothetical protein